MAVQRKAALPQTWIPVTANDVAKLRNRKLRKWSAIALVVLLAGLFAYKLSVDPIEAQQSYDAGLRLFNSARYQQAVLNFNRAISLKSGFADAYRMRARAYRGDGNQDAAVRDFTKVSELAPRETDALIERGQIYLEKKDFSKAVADASAALAINPKLARAYNLRGVAMRLTGNLEKAVEDFTKALENDPSLDNYFQRASTYQMLGRHDLAIADFNQAIAIAPDQPHVYFARSKSKLALGDSKGATLDYQTGRKLDGF